MAGERRSGGLLEISRLLQRRLEGLYNKRPNKVGARAKTKLESLLGFLDLVFEAVLGSRSGGELSLYHG
jgi:hypothetical protein